MFSSKFMPEGPKRKKFQLQLMQLYCSFFVAAWSGVIRYHGPRPEKRPNQIFVANHTTVFDIVVLQQNFCFSIVGQKQPGVIGELSLTFITLFRILSRPCIELLGVS